MEHRIDDPDLDVHPDDVLVMRNAGPLGGPGMPEWGFLPLPRKLLQRGIRDMVRLSDARMSGTAFGTVVVHVTPESASGSPLAAVQSGDIIELDVPNRRLDLLVEGTGGAAEAVGDTGAEAALREGVRRDVLAACDAGGQGVRLRFFAGGGDVGRTDLCCRIR